MRQWHFYHVCAQSCLTLCDLTDCSPSGPFACPSSSSVHGTFQAGILEWVAISFSRVSSQPRYWPCISYVSWIAGRFFPHEAIREAFVFLLFVFQPLSRASLVFWMVKNLPVKQETRVWSLGSEDSPEKGMATPSSVFAWRIPWTEEPGLLQPMGSQRIRHD